MNYTFTKKITYSVKISISHSLISTVCHISKSSPKFELNWCLICFLWTVLPGNCIIPAGSTQFIFCSFSIFQHFIGQILRIFPISSTKSWNQQNLFQILYQILFVDQGQRKVLQKIEFQWRIISFSKTLQLLSIVEKYKMKIVHIQRATWKMWNLWIFRDLTNLQSC